MSNDQPTEDEPGDDPTSGKSRGERRMGCQPSLEELYKYMDGYFDDKRQAKIRTHLDACGGCGELYHFHTGLRHLVGSRCRTELPADLPQRVFRALDDLR